MKKKKTVKFWMIIRKINHVFDYQLDKKFDYRMECAKKEVYKMNRFINNNDDLFYDFYGKYKKAIKEMCNRVSFCSACEKMHVDPVKVASNVVLLGRPTYMSILDNTYSLDLLFSTKHYLDYSKNVCEELYDYYMRANGYGAYLDSVRKS